MTVRIARYAASHFSWWYSRLQPKAPSGAKEYQLDFRNFGEVKGLTFERNGVISVQ